MIQKESTSLWSFPVRGNWATHNSNYRGNFAPQVPRNIMEMYSTNGDLVFDPMVGAGTTLIEAKLLHRNAIGMDINPQAIEISNKALTFNYKTNTFQKAFIGDARHLCFLEDTFDLIIAHPPYLNLVKYSNGSINNDLSNIRSLVEFCNEIEVIARELFRVLKQNKYCAVLIGDTRKFQHYVPLSFNVLERFLKVGFALKEEIIKVQHNCTFAKKWEAKAKEFRFYLIVHEHLFIFRKPKLNENINKISWSMYSR